MDSRLVPCVQLQVKEWKGAEIATNISHQSSLKISNEKIEMKRSCLPTNERKSWVCTLKRRKVRVFKGKAFQEMECDGKKCKLMALLFSIVDLRLI